MTFADRRRAIAALTIAGLLWGTTVPMTKLALLWLPPGWLAAVRFALAAAILLAVARRAAVRAACTPKILAWGAVGYGGTVILQNAGVARTSVTHAALLIGAAPVLVAVIAAVWRHAVARPVAWAGFAVSLAGVGLITKGSAGGASAAGDGLVLASLLLSAAFIVAQSGMLRGRDPIAVTAVQFLGAALAAVMFSAVTEGAPPAPAGWMPAAVTAALVLVGTLAPFTLCAYGQARVSAEVAGAFVNIEPLVGALIGIALFGDPFGVIQAAGGTAVIAGIALSTLPVLGAARRPRLPAAPAQPSPERDLNLTGAGHRLRGDDRPDEVRGMSGQETGTPLRGVRHQLRRHAAAAGHPADRRPVSRRGRLPGNPAAARRSLGPGGQPAGLLPAGDAQRRRRSVAGPSAAAPRAGSRRRPRRRRPAVRR